MDLNSARIEVLLEEIIREIKMFHDQYAEALTNIDRWCNTWHMDREELFSLLNEAVVMSSKLSIELVRDQIDLSTEEERKPFYYRQLTGIQDNLEKALAIPLKMKRVGLNE
jgi:hypothetical protein